jgi:thymidylate synthase ThyX
MNKASLVYDHVSKPVIPKAMGQPKAGQLTGNNLENFAELCGRICYDSLGKGRDSESYHQHIADIKHYNIYEGCVRTFVIPFNLENIIACSNRPGVWFVKDDNGDLRVTMNVRAAIEWTGHLAIEFKIAWAGLMPMVVKSDFRITDPPMLVRPKFDHEKWLTFWIECSRAVSHEQVRHRWQCHVSQRSTRFCDESESNRIVHPLIREFKSEHPLDTSLNTNIVYSRVYDSLYPWLISKGLDKQTARKQARGCAREYLEHQLSTQMMFGASLKQWDWMISERSSKWADGAIREMYLESIEPIVRSYGLPSSN